MSHIVTIETRIHDPHAVVAACARLGLAAPVQGTAKLFGGDVAGLLVQLPDWQYPAVVDILTGSISYDNYEGHWGDAQHLDRFLQAYAVERVRLEARSKNLPVTEQALPDGSIQLQIAEAY